MKKNFIYALMSAIALTGAVSFSACSSSDEIVDNPDYNPETNSVKTTITLSVNPNNEATTRQASDIVQASGSAFRGIGSILCIPSIGDITTTSSTTGKLSWEAITAFDGSSSNYKLYTNQEVAVGVNHFLFIGKAPYTFSTPAANLANGYTSNNLSSASTVGEIAVTPESIVASDDISTSDSETKNWKYQSDALAAYLTTIANADGWNSSDNANLLGLYQQFTRTSVTNAGSAESVRLLLLDLYTKLQGLGDLTGIPASIRSAIVTAITDKADVSGTSSPYTLTWKDGNEWDDTFPINFGLPEGSAQYQWNTSASPSAAFEYIVDGTLNALATPVGKFVYPNELYYLTKTPLKATSSAVVNWPANVSGWTAETWSSWDDAVQASSKNIALKYNVNYGSALLATTIKAGAETLYDNARKLDPDKVGVASATNNAIVVKTGSTEQNPFQLTGVLIGAQPSSAAWNFLPKGGDFDKVVYDNTMNGTINVQTTANATPNYTLVFDDYKETPADVSICLEFKNNLTTRFYGKNGVILPGQTFYIVGKLNLTNPTPSSPIPENSGDNTDDALDTYFPNRALRAFIQDYTTTANFTITPGTVDGDSDGSLSEAVTTIPDLRTSSQNIGLSVDLAWKTGLIFNVNLGE